MNSEDTARALQGYDKLTETQRVRVMKVIRALSSPVGRYILAACTADTLEREEDRAIAATGFAEARLFFVDSDVFKVASRKVDSMSAPDGGAVLPFKSCFFIAPYQQGIMIPYDGGEVRGLLLGILATEGRVFTSCLSVEGQITGHPENDFFYIDPLRETGTKEYNNVLNFVRVMCAMLEDPAKLQARTGHKHEMHCKEFRSTNSAYAMERRPFYNIAGNMFTKRLDKLTPKDIRSFSLRWDVRGHIRHLVQMGETSLDTKQRASLNERGYTIVEETPTGWRAEKATRVKSFIKGPLDKPYLPAVRRVG